MGTRKQHGVKKEKTKDNGVASVLPESSISACLDWMKAQRLATQAGRVTTLFFLSVVFIVDD